MERKEGDSVRSEKEIEGRMERLIVQGEDVKERLNVCFNKPAMEIAELRRAQELLSELHVLEGQIDLLAWVLEKSRL